MTTTQELTLAFLADHAALQRLTFLLEDKGIISDHDHAAIWGETLEGEPSFRAAPPEPGRDEDSDESGNVCSRCTHADNSGANTGMQSRSPVMQTGESGAEK